MIVKESFSFVFLHKFLILPCIIGILYNKYVPPPTKKLLTIAINIFVRAIVKEKNIVSTEATIKSITVISIKNTPLIKIELMKLKSNILIKTIL